MLKIVHLYHPLPTWFKRYAQKSLDRSLLLSSKNCWEIVVGMWLGHCTHEFTAAVALYCWGSMQEEARQHSTEDRGLLWNNPFVHYEYALL